MSHPYRVSIHWSDEDACFVAVMPELPGCTAHGATIAEAAAEAETAMELWLETAEEMGRPLPETSEEREGRAANEIAHRADPCLARPATIEELDDAFAGAVGYIVRLRHLVCNCAPPGGYPDDALSALTTWAYIGRRLSEARITLQDARAIYETWKAARGGRKAGGADESTT